MDRALHCESHFASSERSAARNLSRLGGEGGIFSPLVTLHSFTLSNAKGHSPASHLLGGPLATSDSLLCSLARKRLRQRQRRDVPCRAARLLRMVRKVFFHHANDSDCALSIGHARQPVPSRHAEQLIMHQEALGKTCQPAQAGSIPRHARLVSAPLAVLFNACTCTDFQEVPARPADIRLLLLGTPISRWASARPSAFHPACPEPRRERRQGIVATSIRASIVGIAQTSLSFQVLQRTLWRSAR